MWIDDVVQETRIRMWKYPHIKASVCARTAAADYFRAQARRVESMPYPVGFDSPYERDEQQGREALADAGMLVNRLPPFLRAEVRRMEQGLPAGTDRQRVYRVKARKRLREMLALSPD